MAGSPERMKRNNWMQTFKLLLFAFAFLGSIANTRSTPGLAVVKTITGATYGQDTLDTPPDSDGSIGPAHYVEFINGLFAVFDKTSGARIKSESDVAFWSDAGVSIPSGWSVTDPRIVYDVDSGRWFASQVDYETGMLTANRFLLAVSETSDPTAGWHGFGFLADPQGGGFADFPTLGMNHSCVILSSIIYSPGSNGTVLGTTIASVPKSDLLLVSPTVTNRFSSGLLPVGSYGETTQPVVNLDPGSNDSFALGIENDFQGSHLLLWNVENGAGRAPGLSAPSRLDVGYYSYPVNPFQPDGENLLNDGDARISSSVYELNGILYGVHAVQLEGLAELRYFRIEAATGLILDTGRISDGSLNLFYPSIAVNFQGVVVIAFNGCGTNSYVSAYAVAGETVNGHLQFGTPLLIASGTASYAKPSADGTSRWGDYSSIGVDPADPTQFWTIQEIPTAATTFEVRIVNLSVALPPPPTITARYKPGAFSLLWPTNANDFVPETSWTLGATASWSGLTATSIVNGTNFEVTVSAGPTTNQFFRLRR
jgi:hypothetical protein